MAGMLATCGGRVLTEPETDDMGDDGVMVSRTPRESGDHVRAEWVGYITPDFRDPATVGCLLALVREVLGEPLASVEVRQPGELGCRACVRAPVGEVRTWPYQSEGWRVVQWGCASQDPQHSEAAALVAALESAND